MELAEKKIYDESDLVVSITESDATTIIQLLDETIENDLINESNGESGVYKLESESIPLKESGMSVKSVKSPSSRDKVHNVRFVHSSWETVGTSSSSSSAADKNGVQGGNAHEFESRYGLVFVGNGRNPTNAHGK